MDLLTTTRILVLKVRTSDGFAPRLFEATAALGIVTALAAVAAPFWLLLIVQPERNHPIDRLLMACQEGLRRGSLADAGIAAGVASVVWGMAVLSLLLGRGARDLKAMRRFGAELSAVSFGLGSLSEEASGVTVLADRVAFTAGLIRPRIYIGADLIGEFAADELEAVMLHERRHQRSYDPLRCWLVDLALGAIMLRPMKSLSAYYRASREVAADRAAVEAQGDDRPLLRALAAADPFGGSSGACGLSAQRQSALRAVRHFEAGLPHRDTALLLLGLSAMLGVLGLAVIGLSDWQWYWFCPYGGSMPA